MSNELILISVACVFNIVLWCIFFVWVTKPERERRKVEKRMRQEE